MKQLFWVIENEEPILVSGFLKPEDDGEWCAGELRLHLENGTYYSFYFNTAQDAIQHKIKLIEHEIEFEKEMFDDKLKEMEKDKEHWISLLKEHENP